MGKYLNEERYEGNKKKISLIALVVFCLGLSLGIGLITLGVIKNNKIDSKYSEESKDAIKSQIAEEKVKLENKKSELKNKGVVASSNYENGEAYDLYIITEVLDPGFNHCAFDEYSENPLTSKYCSLKEELDDLNRSNGSEFDKSSNVVFFMFGAFVIIATCMISFAIFMVTKRREMLAFGLQQVMPVAKEGMEEIAPTIGKVGSEIAKNMAPAYGEIAKEISKGIKEGLQKDEEE